MKLHLTLEKDGVTKLESVDLSKYGFNLTDFVKKIIQYYEEKWKLKDVKCKNKEVEKFFQNLIDEYEADPEKFSGPVLDPVKLGLKIAKKYHGYDYKTWKEKTEKQIEKQLKKSKQKR